jgi:E3 ubiquitin-protein ligase CCNP1IP1
MVLAGLRPEIVMDIASRAISFWSYQVHLEHMYQENSVKTYRERLSQLEVSYEALVAKIKSEMTGLKRQIEGVCIF